MMHRPVGVVICEEREEQPHIHATDRSPSTKKPRVTATLLNCAVMVSSLPACRASLPCRGATQTDTCADASLAGHGSGHALRRATPCVWPSAP
eukprot:11594311-Alexandrium_andersonii.AAC.1